MVKGDGRASDEVPAPADSAVDREGPTAPFTARPRLPTRELPTPVGSRATQAELPALSPRRATGQVPVPQIPVPGPPARRATGQVPVTPTVPPPTRRPTGQVPVAPPTRRPTGQVPVASAPPTPARRATGEVRLPPEVPRTATPARELQEARLEEETTAPLPIPRRATVGVESVGSTTPAAEPPRTSLPRRPSTGVPAQGAPSKPPPPVDLDDDEATTPLSMLPSRRSASLPPPVDDLPDEPTSVGQAPQAPPARESETVVRQLADVDGAPGAGSVGRAGGTDVQEALDPEATPTPLAPLPSSRPRGLSAEPTRRKAPAPPSDSTAPEELSRVIRMEAARNGAQGGRRFGFQVAIGLVMLLAGGGVFAAFFADHLERPPLETLQLVYPYGFSGGRLPNGRTAPSVADITFDYVGTSDCGGDVCVRYDAHSGDGSFHLSLDLKKVGSDWKLVGQAPAGVR